MIKGIAPFFHLGLEERNPRSATKSITGDVSRCLYVLVLATLRFPGISGRRQTGAMGRYRSKIAKSNSEDKISSSKSSVFCHWPNGNPAIRIYWGGPERIRFWGLFLAAYAFRRKRISYHLRAMRILKTFVLIVGFPNNSSRTIVTNYSRDPSKIGL